MDQTKVQEAIETLHNASIEELDFPSMAKAIRTERENSCLKDFNWWGPDDDNRIQHL